MELYTADLANYLSHFTFEVRKKDGSEFPPDSLHHIVSGIQRYIRWNGNPSIDVFKDGEFADFRMCLDSEMKRLQKAGHGSRKKKAEPLKEEEEELLWKKGFLGSGSPQALVDTMVVMNGIYFALRSGGEHRQLRSDPCQIQLVENAGSRPFLKYTEDISKNRTGGLKGRKLKPKVVQHHDNPQNPERCFVRLFKRYQSLLPQERPKNTFYFQPLKTPTADCWFSSKPTGHNALEGTVAQLCQKAGIPGFRTNHSLRATTATRLYQAGVEEQLIMERTGHRSIEGVRSYKRTSDGQREATSDVLNSKSGSAAPISPPSNQLTVSVNTQPQSSVATPLSGQPMDTVPSAFNFHSCTVNNYNTKN